MISTHDRHRLHQFLMIDLAIRYLEKDLTALQATKCAHLFTSFFEQILRDLRSQHMAERQYFSKKQIRIIRWQRMDHYFSKVLVTTSGEDALLTYANQAVKMHVEEVIQQTFQTMKQ